MKKKYTYTSVSLFTWLFIFYTFSSCVHTKQLLGSGPIRPQSNYWMPQSNALHTASKFLMFFLFVDAQSCPCFYPCPYPYNFLGLRCPEMPPFTSDWKKIKHARFNHPTFDAIRASADTKRAI